MNAVTSIDPTPDPPAGLPAVLAGADLRGVDLRGANLSGLVFDRADLRGARLNGADLRGASLREVDLDDAELLGTCLEGADLSEARARRVVLGHSSLRGAELFHIDLTGANLIGADLTDADLRAATLDQARMLNVTLMRADLAQATLREAHLEGATLTKSSFRGADISGAYLRSVSGYDSTDWIDVIAGGTDFEGAHLLRRVMLDQNYLHEFRHRDRKHAVLYEIWRFSSDCGRSFVRWGLLTAIFAGVFGMAYTQVDIDYGDYETRLSPLYFSVVTLTTLGYGDAVPASMSAQVLVLVEVVLGYVMLGGVLSIFANRMGRRAD